ncbi:MAG TPA: hypothetical protein VGX48_08850 [Pyrinomonadaceae bacterium]|jgi:hypothetical protein|nr:hypothetical protein [Pyrinomonadaceae bacterium]
MANCKSCRQEIEEAAGRAELGRPAEAHLAACGACRDFLKERAALVGLVGGLGRVAAPDDFDVRLRARMASRRDGGRGHFGFNFAMAPAFAAAAAFVFVVGLAAVLYYGRGPSAVRPVAQQEQPAANAPAPAAAPSPSGPVGAERASVGAEIKKGTTLARPAVAPRRRELSRKETAKAAVAETLDYTVRATPPSLIIPVGTSSDSMRVVVRNEDGSPRVVSVRSVSFGAQQLIASGQTATRPAAKSKEGVW